MEVNMSKIKECEVRDCVYNSDKNCHTMGITIGNGSCAICDTFMKSDRKGGDTAIIGGVGACRTENCKFNKSMECTAEGILVGFHSDHADCKTFSPS